MPSAPKSSTAAYPFGEVLVWGLLLASAVLRCADLSVMEFKLDEFDALTLAYRNVHQGFPVLAGLRSSVGLYNPPFFIYLLSIPILFTTDPVALTAFIVSLNLCGLGLLYALLHRAFGKSVALYTTLLMASAPWAIMFSRKLWAQDLLFPVMLACLLSLLSLCEPSKDGHPRAAAGFGAAFAAATQLHMSAWFLPLPILIFVWFFRPVIRWKDALLALVIFAVLYAPYLRFLAQSGGAGSSVLASRPSAEEGPLATLLWSLRVQSGLGFEYLLGKKGLLALQRFTGVTATLWVFVGFCVAAASALVLALARIAQSIRRSVRGESVDRGERLLALLLLIFVCVQLEYTLLRVPAYPHYQILFYPTVALVLVLAIERFSIAGVASRALFRSCGRGLLICASIANLWFTTCVLRLVAHAPAELSGDYGAPYVTARSAWQKKIADQTQRIREERRR